MTMTPKQIVAYLDSYIIGQNDAKKTVAIALRNRYRRRQLPDDLQHDIIPKNILMIGPTGVGKTEIARRIAKMMGLPFIKVEASKFTEVGFVGRDVESMVRDLVATTVTMVKDEYKVQYMTTIDERIIQTITGKLLPPLPKGATEEKQQDYNQSFEKMTQKVRSHTVDHLKVTLDIHQKHEFNDTETIPPELSKMQETFMKFLGGAKTITKEVSVKEAKEILRDQEAEALLDNDAVVKEALDRVQNEGIIFIDEIDKIAVNSKTQGRNDPSKEGVQRDLLPIVEGSTVATKYGHVKTDHILFIGAGAFHMAKPSDLIPELQGRFPLRVELESLDEKTLYAILTQTKHSLIMQYQALFSTEGVTLCFDDEAIYALASYSYKANEKTDDIGARRLHTVIEKVLQELSFCADEHKGETLTITSQHVEEALGSIIENADLTRYIL